MGSVDQLQRQLGGFDFSLHNRNVLLLQRAAADGKGGCHPPLRKTGTTICGVVFNGGVVLGADTRATEGPLVADKNCNKLHKIANCIYAAGAGTAADLDHMCDWLASQVELHRRNTFTKTPRVGMAVCLLSQELFKYQGHRGCALVLGGVDIRGPSLYKIHPHGSTDYCSYAAMGSGSLNAMAVLEAGYKDNMNETEARALVCAAISAGVLNDLGSGGNVDICIIKGGGVIHTRQFASPARPAVKATYPQYERGTTPFFREHVENVKRLVHVEQEVEMVSAS